MPKNHNATQQLLLVNIFPRCSSSLLMNKHKGKVVPFSFYIRERYYVIFDGTKLQLFLEVMSVSYHTRDFFRMWTISSLKKKKDTSSQPVHTLGKLKHFLKWKIIQFHSPWNLIICLHLLKCAHRCFETFRFTPIILLKSPNLYLQKKKLAEQMLSLQGFLNSFATTPNLLINNAVPKDEQCLSLLKFLFLLWMQPFIFNCFKNQGYNLILVTSTTAYVVLLSFLIVLIQQGLVSQQLLHCLGQFNINVIIMCWRAI